MARYANGILLVDVDGNPLLTTSGKLQVTLDLNAADIEIGAFEGKDAATDTRWKIAALNVLAAGDNGLGVADPVLKAALQAILGATSDAAVMTDADGTLNAHLRGLVKSLGDVGASPVANTIQDRIKALLTGIVVAGQKWTALSSVSAIFNDIGVLPALKALASGGLQVSNAIDNSANLYNSLNLSLNVRGASAFTSGSTLDLWILPSLDGANYEDGSASVTPARPPDAYFYPRAVSTAQLLALTLLQIPPTKFKLLLRNSGGQAFTNTNAENTLDAYFNS